MCSVDNEYFAAVGTVEESEAMRPIAIVPARAGSKRIISKNTKLFLGVPIIVRVLKMLRSCGIFEDIVVSTDDEELISNVKNLGFSAPFVRPSELASDYASTADVANHAINYLLDSGVAAETDFCLVYPTAVMTRSETILDSYDSFRAIGCELMFAAAPFSSEIHRAWFRDDFGGVRPIFQGFQSYRSQDLPRAYFDAGQFYWFKRNAWREEVLEQGIGRTLFEVSPLEAVDINTIEDWKLAETIYEIKRGLN